jgi:two-component system, chemotaxis family, chemotaxis protein CheY
MKVTPELRILIIDDSAESVAIMKLYLKKKGFINVYGCHDAENAWTVLNRNKADGNDIECLLVDWNMPNVSGLDFLKRIRNNHSFKNIFFIMVTAEGDPEMVKKAVETEVDSYILKPVTVDSIYDKITHALKKRKSFK